MEVFSYWFSSEDIEFGEVDLSYGGLWRGDSLSAG